MEAYTDFATVYDLFMDETPYSEWADRIIRTLKEYDELDAADDDTLKSEAGLVVDLGCGTGVITRILAEHGYDMIGIDNSYEMLDVARSTPCSTEIMYLNQDMRELELYSTVGAVISVCDCINYLLTEEDVEKTFRLVNNYLFPKGLFIFDFNTVHKYRDVIGETTIAENREEGSFIWENYYYEDEQINEYDLTIYRQNQNGTYDRSEETHVQRGYEPETIINLIEKSGMKLVTIYDSDTGEKVNEMTERVFVVARECGK